MQLARIRVGGRPRPVVRRDDRWHEIDDPFADRPRELGPSWPVEGAALLAPCEPRVVVGMSHNGSPVDRARPPQAFLKSARTVSGPGDPIVVPPDLGQVAVEGELALVIGRHARHLAPGSVLEAVRGVTIANDVTTVGQLALDGLFTQAKNGDGYTPIGPWIETDAIAAIRRITTEVDGVPIAAGTIADLAWSIEEQLVYLTSIMELGPGDVVLTGAPGTTVPIEAGARCRIRIDGLGELENPAIAGRPRVVAPDIILTPKETS